MLSQMNLVHALSSCFYNNHWISSRLCLGLQSFLFLSGFPQNSLHTFIISLMWQISHQTSLFALITRILLVRISSHEASHYTTFSVRQLPPPPEAHIGLTLSALEFLTPPTHVLTFMWETKFYAHIKQETKLHVSVF